MLLFSDWVRARLTAQNFGQIDWYQYQLGEAKLQNVEWGRNSRESGVAASAANAGAHSNMDLHGENTKRQSFEGFAEADE